MIVRSPNGYNLRASRDATYSGYRVRCARCDTVKLTLAEFRKQLKDKPEQIWHCPNCGAAAEFRG